MHVLFWFLVFVFFNNLTKTLIYDRNLRSLILAGMRWGGKGTLLISSSLTSLL